MSRTKVQLVSDIVGNVSGGASFTGIVTATTFSGQVNAGVGTITTLTSTNANITGVSTLGTVKVSSGIITATAGVVTYYGDGSYLTGVAAAGSGGSNDITSNLFF